MSWETTFEGLFSASRLQSSSTRPWTGSLAPPPSQPPHPSLRNWRVESLEFLRRRHVRIGNEIRTFREPVRVLAKLVHGNACISHSSFVAPVHAALMTGTVQPVSPQDAFVTGGWAQGGPFRLREGGREEDQA
ncbi:unnamed protein product, partial [Ixodes hexagonus]